MYVISALWLFVNENSYSKNANAMYGVIPGAFVITALKS